MKQLSFILNIILVLIFSSCHDTNNDPLPSESIWANVVSGKVTINKIPVEGAVVKIDGNTWADTTNAYGNFEIHGVPEFEHYAAIEKNLDSGKFIYLYKMFQMDLDGVDLRTINFDAPTDLMVSDTTIADKNIYILKWNKASDEFLSYNIYMQQYPGITWKSSSKTFDLSVKEDTICGIEKSPGPHYFKVITFYKMPYGGDLKAVGSEEVYK